MPSKKPIPAPKKAVKKPVMPVAHAHLVPGFVVALPHVAPAAKPAAKPAPKAAVPTVARRAYPFFGL